MSKLAECIRNLSSGRRNVPPIQGSVAYFGSNAARQAFEYFGNTNATLASPSQNLRFSDLKGVLEAIATLEPGTFLHSPLESVSKQLEEYPSQFEALKSDLESEAEDLREGFQNTVEKLSERQFFLAEKMNSLHDEHRQNLVSLHTDKESSLNELIGKLGNLEETYNYKKKLQLEAPIKHWETLQDDYRKKGNRWTFWAAGNGAFAVVSLFPQTIRKVSSQLLPFSPRRGRTPSTHLCILVS